ncbi:hypothetical protein H8R13_00365 [Morganella morganii]|uniref:hypothetical protein n=1 Tax=Morganella morganii TaxID=582 RepID=UPI00164C95AF|nr:hypothetical protein [Morganella morganii]MBC4010206.1 hypothetical protein [Morganella morganii]MCF1264381.1 hypothetical protein [Morganella morganii]
MMTSPEEIRLADINALYNQNRTDEIAITEIPFSDFFEKIKDYERRLRDAIDSGYNYIDKQITESLRDNNQIDYLTKIVKNIDENTLYINDNYGQIDIQELKIETDYLMDNIRSLIVEYNAQIALLEKLKLPLLSRTKRQTNSLTSGIDDVINTLRQKVTILNTTLDDYTKFTELLGNIDKVSLMAVSIAGVWQKLATEITPFLLPGASPEGLDARVQALTSYFARFGS